MAREKRLRMADKITKDSIIGTVMVEHPVTAEIFQKHFKTAGCFTCPGAGREDIAFGVMMHNAKLDKLLADLNEAIEHEDSEVGQGQT